MADRSTRGKLRFTGEQATWFLHQLVTNAVEDLLPEQSTEALLLTPKGRITSHMLIHNTGEAVYADVEPGAAPSLAEFFTGRVFTTRVEIEDVSDEWSIYTVIGPSAPTIVNEALRRMYVPEDFMSNCLFGGGFLVKIAYPFPGVEVWTRRENSERVARDLVEAGAVAISEGDLSDVQTIAGMQVLGRDFDDTFLPQEAALERAVHFAKGCYLGQEAVAMAQRGLVKRRLRHLVFQGEPETGALTLEGEQVGTVTSVAQLERRGFGIAVVKTSVPVGAEVAVGESGVAAIAELPGTTEGPRPPSARELRERLQGSASSP